MHDKDQCHTKKNTLESEELIFESIHDRHILNTSIFVDQIYKSKLLHLSDGKNKYICLNMMLIFNNLLYSNLKQDFSTISSGVFFLLLQQRLQS